MLPVWLSQALFNWNLEPRDIIMCEIDGDAAGVLAMEALGWPYNVGILHQLNRAIIRSVGIEHGKKSPSENPDMKTSLDHRFAESASGRALLR